ncbi:WD40 repeat-like protein [Polychaeton citri CBS 116435]|uniref:WD40 repeat-like protein n=1 Tax=Polychaeton citri CBS 116435 TaxID=1314669 RepID=A0A9P4QG30_9PEZI|nr:WD40 repeat-like protein [Polychaeton citri CBS 116435]
MNSFLLNRQLGNVSQHEFEIAQNQRQLRSLQSAGNIYFRGRKDPINADDEYDDSNDGVTAATATRLRTSSLAHVAGASSIAIDRFEGKYLLSGGADSSISMWDLESPRVLDGNLNIYEPIERVARTSTKQSLGITHVAFYPFDSLAFLTTGYDHTLKVFSSETLQVSASFDLGSITYSQSMSTAPSSDLLVACATQHPAVRLVDLRSGANTHSLAGHSGSVMSVAWHPKVENILASGAADGCVRLWDVRRSASSLGVLDMDDSIGIAGYDGTGTGARRRERGRAHNGAVNGLTWTEDGRFLVSYGQDDRMRVWDMEGGANTLATFGPALKNPHPSVCNPLLAPEKLSPAGQEMVLVANGEEILGFDLHSGTLMKRLRCVSLHVAGSRGGHMEDRGIRNLKSRTTSLAWRAFSVEMYSSHSDGTIRCWKPRMWEDEIADVEEDGNHKERERDDADLKRKREDLDQIVRNLTRNPVTFT